MRGVLFLGDNSRLATLLQRLARWQKTKAGRSEQHGYSARTTRRLQNKKCADPPAPATQDELARISWSFSTYLTPSCFVSAVSHAARPLSCAAGIEKRTPL